MGIASPPGRARAPRLSSGLRRRQLAEAAAAAFHRQGFHRVTIAGVAASVGMSAPAVYRHFANKNALLAGAVETGLDAIDEALRRPAAQDGGLDGLLAHLADAAVRRPDFWTLTQREIRHLGEAEQQWVRARFRAVTEALGGTVGRARPDLDASRRDVVVAAALAVLAAPSTMSSAPPSDELAATLAAVARALCATPFASPASADAAPPAPAVDGAPSRAGEVLDAAATLFHRRGFSAVSIDDIGASVGIAGPSIYHHYASKTDLLIDAMERFGARVPAVDPDDDPDQLWRAYIRLAIIERECLGVWVTETIELPEDVARRLTRRTDDELDRWAALALRGRPSPVGEARVLVQLARAVVHDVVRLGRHHLRPGLEDELALLVATVLRADPHASSG